MRRAIVGFIIGVVCLFSSGCVGSMTHSYTHPHSEITAPAFCFYDGRPHHKDKTSLPIYRIRVLRDKKQRGHERLEWRNWILWRDGRYAYPVAWEMEYGDPVTEAAEKRYTDQVAWEMEYVPDDQAHPLTRPFSCITYGKVPPGYDETIPAVPLIPERLYTVLLETQEVTARGGMYFIIRSDLAGHPTQLEYTIKPTRLDQIRVITQQ